MDIVLSADSSVQQHTLTQVEAVVSLVVPKHVQATVTLVFDAAMQQATIQTTVHDYASLTLLCVQPADVQQSIRQTNVVHEGAKLHCQNITLGADVQHVIESELQGANAISSVDWMAYAKGKEKQVLSATNVFSAPNGGGEMTIKSVAEDTARVGCTGFINIGLSGGGTDTYLTEDVLMLDPTCVIDAIPGLEIKTNDVKASHSATVSRVTATDLFYFQARGINEKEAREMYVVGFLGDVLERITNEELRISILESITNKYRTTTA